MRKRLSSLVSLIVSLVLCTSMIPATALAAVAQTPRKVTGTFQYETTFPFTGTKALQEDTFEFREDCFMRSSFLGCTHLALLSEQFAVSTKNISTVEGMLKDMGFSNVSSNKTYTAGVHLPDGVGVTMGKLPITQDGKRYTLIAIIPQSNGYSQEWVGNFTVGETGIHQGFKAARDEVLRYLRSFVETNGIKGNLKV